MKLKRKTFVLVLALFLAGLMVGAMAMPRIAEAQKAARERAILFNLRIISTAAGCVMAEKGVMKITYRQLRDEHYLSSVKVVAGESYDAIVFTRETRSISAVLPNGEVISYYFGALC